jgi:hypothetical protein
VRIAAEGNGERHRPETKPNNVIQSVARACALLQCFPKRGRTRNLNELTELSHLSKPTVFRLLFTLVESGMLERTDKNTYQLSASNSPTQYRLGYASQSEEFSFSRLVSDSIRTSCYEAGFDLLVLNNRYSPKVSARCGRLKKQAGPANVSSWAITPASKQGRRCVGRTPGLQDRSVFPRTIWRRGRSAGCQHPERRGSSAGNLRQTSDCYTGERR